jgi:hypothetical protein
LRKHVTLLSQDDWTWVEEFDLSSALKLATTALGYFTKALNDLPIIACVENIIDKVVHVNLLL